MANKKAILIGPRGVGKTLIFQGLVPRKARFTSFYPGTETKVSRGEMKIGKDTWELVDLPPIWSLYPIAGKSRSRAGLMNIS